MLRPEALFKRSLWNAKPKFKVDEADQHLVDSVGTLLLPMQRDRLLRYLPSGGRVAEIGVARGHFSAQIKAVCKPSFLALVDPWCEQDQTIYYADSNNARQSDQDQRYKAVSRRFASTKPGAECRIVRNFSAQAVGEFQDKSFDWVFVDGNHSYEACLEDLRLWAPKVKDDGLLCGHDFAAHAPARESRYGVVEAVQTFVKETGYVFAALTIEQFPTFVIAKAANGPTLARLRRLMFSFERHVIQLKHAEAAHFEHARILENGMARSAFVSFDPTKS